MNSSPAVHRVRGVRSSGGFALACMALVLSACSAVQVRYPDGHYEWHSREDFAAYVETVFRHHNRVVNDLIVAASLLSDDAVTENLELLRAEETMAAICQPLNDVVAARIEGREIGLFEKLQLPHAVPACEAASTRLENLLPAL